MAKSGPERSCLGCGTVREKDDLLRFVLAPDTSLVVDLKGKLPGRGAYTCLSRKCLEQAIRKKRFAAAFKTPLTGIDGEVLVSALRRLITERISGYLSLAAKAGKVFSGGDAVAAGLRSGKAGLLFMATDLSEESRKKYASVARHAGVAVVALFDKECLGALVGKEHRGVVAVEPGGFIAPFQRELQIFRNFFDGEV